MKAGLVVPVWPSADFVAFWRNEGEESVTSARHGYGMGRNGLL